MDTLRSKKYIFEEIVAGILEVLKEDAVAIILYGSVARATETEESDVDIAILIRNKLSREKRDALDDFLGDMDLKHERLFSAVDIEEKKFETWKQAVPFYQNVSREGIVLWRAA